MNSMIGKLLILFGLILIVLGAILMIAPHIPFLGKLPGDIRYEGKSVHFYFPIVTCIVISVLLTLIFSFFNWMR